jgi:hypothetical protein
MVQQRELMGRIARSKKRVGLSRSLTIRLPNDLYDRLEAYAGDLAADMPGMNLTVSDVVRNLLEQSMVEWTRAGKRVRRDQQVVDELLASELAAPKKEEGI